MTPQYLIRMESTWRMRRYWCLGRIGRVGKGIVWNMDMGRGRVRSKWRENRGRRTRRVLSTRVWYQTTNFSSWIRRKSQQKIGPTCECLIFPKWLTNRNQEASWLLAAIANSQSSLKKKTTSPSSRTSKYPPPPPSKSPTNNTSISACNTTSK